MVVQNKSIVTGYQYEAEINIDPKVLEEYWHAVERKPIQQVAPHLDIESREFLKTGMSFREQEGACNLDRYQAIMVMDAIARIQKLVWCMTMAELYEELLTQGMHGGIRHFFQTFYEGHVLLNVDLVHSFPFTEAQGFEEVIENLGFQEVRSRMKETVSALDKVLRLLLTSPL